MSTGLNVTPLPTSPGTVQPTDGPLHFGFVDALRGLAILMVILVHASMNVPGFGGRLRGIAAEGQYGVQLFFVISAFTLFWSLRSRTRVDRHQLAAFFTRRICRIGPLFWVAVAFYGQAMLHQPRNPYVLKWAPAGLHWAHLFITAIFLHGWYPTTINSVVPGGWSIAAEFSFYLTIPFLFATVRTLDAALWLAFISAAIVAICQGPAVTHLSHHFPADWKPLIGEFVFYSFPTQFPVFCLGIVLYFLVLFQQKKPALQHPSISSNSRGVLFILLGVLLIFGSVPRHIFVSVAFVALTYGLLLRPLPLIVNSIMRFFGTISYSAYIWHFVVLEKITAFVLKSPAIHRLSPNADHAMRFLEIFLGTAIGVMPVAALSYYVIELSGQNLGKWIIRRCGWGAVPSAPALMSSLQTSTSPAA